MLKNSLKLLINIVAKIVLINENKDKKMKEKIGILKRSRKKLLMEYINLKIFINGIKYMITKSILN